MKLEGSKTEQNLKEAFAGESQATNKYLYYSSKAKKEGYEQISAILGVFWTRATFQKKVALSANEK